MARERGPRFVAAAVFLALAAATGLGSWGAARAVDDRGETLLGDRAQEAATILGGIARQFETSFGSLAAVARVTGGDPALFRRAATTEVAGGELQIVALLDTQGTVAAIGSDAARLAPASGPERHLIEEAAASPMLVTDVFERGRERRLGLAVATEPGGPVVYGEATLDSTTGTGFASRGPFAEIEVALFARPSLEAEGAILSTTELPLHGETARASVPIGGDKWTVLVAARSPLVGRLSAALPWVILGAGLAVAILAGFVVDVRAGRRRAREAVELATEAARVRSLTLGAVAHDLRTPLTAVLGFVHFLRTRGQDLPEDVQADTYERIARQTARLERLVRDLLDATEVESNPLAAQTRPTSLPRVLEEVLAAYTDPDRARIATLMDGALPAVMADEDRLQRVLVNLVDNAVKYSPEDAPVSVSAVPGAGTVSILVRDEGEGIDPALIPHLFDPFTQSQAAVPRRRGGIGLGLYIARGFVDAMGGRLEIESRPGQGTTARVVLRQAEDGARFIPDVPGSLGARPLSDSATPDPRSTR